MDEDGSNASFGGAQNQVIYFLRFIIIFQNHYAKDEESMV